MEHKTLASSIVLIVGARSELAPIGLAGLLAGHSLENTIGAAHAAFNLEDEDREWIALFGRYCRDRGARCIWLRRMSEARLAVRYGLDGPALSFVGCGDMEGLRFGQDAIQGIWYRGLPVIPTFPSEDEQAFGERETEAFWEGYGHHVRVPVLNRPRTAGLRPATWENFLVRHLVAGQLGLKIPRQGVAEPRPEPPGRAAAHVYQTLSTHRVLEPDRAAGTETCTRIELRRAGRIAVSAIHVGPEVVLSQRADEAVGPLSPTALPAELARSLSEATRAIGRLLSESFGEVLWDVDPRRACFSFRDYTTNPDGRTLTALGPYLFPSIWRFLTREGGGL
jgi:hypothetical protein